MKVTVKYFALLREAMETGEELLDLPEGIETVRALREWLVAKDNRHAAGFAAVKRIRASVDGAMARDDDAVRDGSEVAFFPPVTGG